MSFLTLLLFGLCGLVSLSWYTAFSSSRGKNLCSHVTRTRTHACTAREEKRAEDGADDDEEEVRLQAREGALHSRQKRTGERSVCWCQVRWGGLGRHDALRWADSGCDGGYRILVWGRGKCHGGGDEKKARKDGKRTSFISNFRSTYWNPRFPHS